MLHSHRKQVQAKRVDANAEEAFIRMTLGGPEAPLPRKPFEEKVCLIAKRLDQLTNELARPDLPPERAEQVRARIEQLGGKAEWLLGGHFENGVREIGGALLKQIRAKSDPTAQDFAFIYSALQGISGAPVPKPQAPVLSLPASVMARLPTSRIPWDASLLRSYLRYSSSLSDAAGLLHCLENVPGFGEDAREAGRLAVRRNETKVLHGLVCSYAAEIHPLVGRQLFRSRRATQAEIQAMASMAADSSAHPARKRAALWALGDQLESSRALPPPIEELALAEAGNQQAGVRAAASRLLALSQSHQAGKGMERLLKDPEGSVRAIALRAARESGRKVAPNTLFTSYDAILKESSEEGVVAAAEEAAQHLQGAGPSAHERLGSIARDEERSSVARRCAVLGLHASSHTPTQETLYQLLRCEDDEVAEAAQRSLAEFPIAHLRSRLIEDIKAPSTEGAVRKNSIRALGSRTSVLEQRVLFEILQGGDDLVRLDAAHILGSAAVQHVRPQVVAHLEEELKGSHPLRAFSSIIALGRVHTHEERLIAMKALGHRFPVVRQGAAEVLLRTGSDALDSDYYLGRIRDTLSIALSEGIAREEELGDAVHALVKEAGFL